MKTLSSLKLALVVFFSLGSSTFANAAQSGDCVAGVQRDLIARGYAIDSDFILLSKEDGTCDGQTCNTDTLNFHVLATKNSEQKSKNLIVKASGPARGESSCRVIQVLVAR